MPQRPPNRLIGEKSPYLLQHAHNPVDWFPWGEEAFRKAREEDKPILLSIGYSTCHWCHVMERESFEREDVAEVMNRNLVCIKLDREERPDVDKIYMSAVQAMTGSGGWPLNTFLTHDLKPFFGGTYFPPEPRWGRIGWPQLVERVGAAWKDPAERLKLVESGKNISDGLRRFLASPPESQDCGEEVFARALEEFRGSYDELGGFSHSPKFPMPVNQNLLFRIYARLRRGDAERAESARDLALGTLRGMARGGIYDHLGGGFSRYSTDARWHVPHFEKMLYDNAQLVVNYMEAFQITGDADFARVARETLDYVRRDMTHPEGGFYSAEDADSLPEAGAGEKKEGAFYVWERDEVMKLLGPEAGGIFCLSYGVEPGGNALEDPQGEFQGKNILYEAHSIDEVAERLKKSTEEVARTLEFAKKTLFAKRAERPRPHLDDKVIASWNGLMISAFARAAQALGEPEYAAAGARAADFLRKNLYDAGAKTLYRRWRDGERQVAGTSDDYAFLAQGLIDLYEAGFDARWLAWAVELTETLLAKFFDRDHGGFFMTAEGHDKNLLFRVREDSDNVEPCAGSVAALTLLRLAHFTDRADFREAAEKTLRAHGAGMSNQPRALPQMLCALDYARAKPVQIVLSARTADDFAEMRRVAAGPFLPNKILIGLTDANRAEMERLVPFLKNLGARDGRPTAYLCENFACRLPVTDPGALARDLADFSDTPSRPSPEAGR